MPSNDKLRLGEDFRLYVDTANNWASPVWVEVKCADTLSADNGVITAEFKCRGESQVGHRRSTMRDPKLTLSLFVKPGDAAFDFIRAASRNTTNDGGEILHLAVVDGAIAAAGNEIRENDFVVLSSSDDYATNEGTKVDLELGSAIDSANAETFDTTS